MLFVCHLSKVKTMLNAAYNEFKNYIIIDITKYAINNKDIKKYITKLNQFHINHKKI